MKRLLFALVLGSSAPAWALDGLVIKNLNVTRNKISLALADASWLRFDAATNARYAHLLQMINEQVDTITLLIDDADPAMPQLNEVLKASAVYENRDEGPVGMLQMLDALIKVRRVLTDLISPVVMHDGQRWGETKPGRLLKSLSDRLQNILRSFTADVDQSLPRTQSTQALNDLLQPWIDRTFFLGKLTNDQNLKTSIERIGILLEERHAIVPNLAHPNATLVQERASILKAFEELESLRRSLDESGLDCSLELAGAAARPHALEALLRPAPPAAGATPSTPEQ